MQIAEIIAEMEQFAPTYLQEDYDNCGLIVGYPADTCNAALLSLDCTEDTVTEAIKKNVI